MCLNGFAFIYSFGSGMGGEKFLQFLDIILVYFQNKNQIFSGNLAFIAQKTHHSLDLSLFLTNIF